MSRRFFLLLALLLAATTVPTIRAQTAVTTPQAEFGHSFGDDYFLATYRQLVAYWQKLDRESDRMTLQSIGKTAEGREQLMAIVTSPTCTSLCGLALWPLTVTFPPLMAFWASERVLKRQATSSHTSSRCADGSRGMESPSL